MEAATQDLVLHQTNGIKEEQTTKQENNPQEQQPPSSNAIKFHLPKLKHYKWWCRVILYILLVLVGQTTATLLGRLYFDKGGNSKWMSTLVQSAGFPILIPLLLFFRKSSSPQTTPSLSIPKLSLLYFIAGVFITGDNLLYSYGLLYLPVSTYSLLCATQLAFNAVTSFFINAQKFTMLILNSVVLLSISACLLAINVDNEGGTQVSKGKYTIGFLTTIGASALYSLLLSSAQYFFEKIVKNTSFNTVVSLQFYPSIVASFVCVVGLFASGEWKTIHKEFDEYKLGNVSYVTTLVWIAINWQMFAIGLLGLIFEVSSLFGNVIGTVGLPLVPVFAVVFFGDKMGGVKVVSLVLAVWGFVSYIYQHYLDDANDGKIVVKGSDDDDQIPCNTIELC